MPNAEVRVFLLTAAVLALAPMAHAQEPTTRTAIIEQEQAAKVPTLKPYQPNAGEVWAERAEGIIMGGGKHWHPFFQSAYSGGGFTLGAGYLEYLSAYNTIDVRGSWTFSGYLRAEAEFVAPRLFDRRGELSILGGWRRATQVGFYGTGIDTPVENATNYSFEQPYGSALMTVFPSRRFFMVRGGLEFSQWQQEPGEGSDPSVEEVYTPQTLPGLGAEATYLHSQATVGFDWRTSPGYSRRGGFAGVTAHDFYDPDGEFGFRRIDYEVIHHFPILRETWVISARGLASTISGKQGEEIPFFMLPSLGGGSNLRGYSSWRFRDRASLLMQAEWRIMVNRFLDTAVFYDTGTVSSHISNLALNDLKDDWGFGVRLHGPFATPLRVDFAKSNEGFHIVFASTAVF